MTHNKEELSSGILVKVNNNYAIGHVTHREWYDIFKGHVENQETILQAALRECKEESSIEFDAKDLTYVGFFDYTKKKDMVLFLGRKNDLKVEHMKCTTFLENGSPEMDGFEIVSFNEMISKVSKAMKNLLKYYEQDIRSF